MGWGDILMAMGDAKSVHDETGKRIVFPEDRFFSQDTYWGAAFEKTPYICRANDVAENEEVIYFRNGIEITPYIDWKKSTREKMQFVPYKPKPAKLNFSMSLTNQLTEIKRQLGSFIFIEPHAKGSFSAKNKDWGFNNYQQVVDQVEAQFVQPSYGAPLLKGVKPIKTSHFLEGAALLSISDTALMSEGGLMHAAAAVNTASVVIYGGYVSPDNTGYEIHKNFYVGGQPCGSLEPCKHCEAAMKKISPRIVAKKLSKLYQALVKK